MELSAPSVLPDAIYSELRAAIVAQAFAPGSTITESAVALRCGVARPTAKMAIENLVSDGILQRQLHQAARVPELDRDDVIDLYDNRAVVEGAAVAALAEIGAVPAEAATAQRRLVASAEHFAEDDIAFHRALVAGQPSPRLARMHSLLMGEIELCIGQVQAGHLVDAKDVASQHEGILAAIVAADPALAAERITTHIHIARDALVAHLDERHA